MDAIDKINRILTKKGLTGADLERMIGVSNSVYSQWNTKSTKPSKKSLFKVAEALEIDVSEIEPDSAKEEQKERPTLRTESEPFPGYSDLTEDEKQKVSDYIDLILAARKNG